MFLPSLTPLALQCAQKMIADGTMMVEKGEFDEDGDMIL